MYFWSRSESTRTTATSESKKKSGEISIDELEVPTLAEKAKPPIATMRMDTMKVGEGSGSASGSASNSQSILPSPATAPTASNPSKKKKSARIEQGLRVHWARFKKRIGNGSEGPSESLLEHGSTEASSWTHRTQLKRTRTGEHERDAGGEEEEEPVDEVIVDRTWTGGAEGELMTASQSEGAAAAGGSSPDKSGGSHQHATSTDHESLMPQDHGFWGWCVPLTIVRYRMWPAAVEFFTSKFYDEKAEEHYRKEIWFSSKVRYNASYMR